VTVPGDPPRSRGGLGEFGEARTGVFLAQNETNGQRWGRSGSKAARTTTSEFGPSWNHQGSRPSCVSPGNGPCLPPVTLVS